MPQAAPGPSASGSDWTVQATDRIESVIGAVRDKTTVPITKAARALVYGLIAGAMGSLALVLGAIGVLKLHVYLPFHPEGRKVYVTYLGIGAILLIIGLLLWRKRTKKSKG
jgi:hypothetical protein